MTSYELLNEIDEFLTELNSQEKLLGALENIATGFDSLIDFLHLSAKKSDTWMVFRFMERVFGEYYPITERDIRESLKETAGELIKLSASEIFLSIDRLNSSINKLDANIQEYPLRGRPFASLSKALVDFAKNYESFLSRHDIPSTYYLLYQGKILNDKLKHVTDTIAAVRVSLADNIVPTTNDVLTLLLKPTSELVVLNDKLQALAIIYEELCRLLDVSTSVHPLRVIKLESGSLWTQVFGEGQIIKLMTDLIRSGVQYLHRNFTQEGKLSATSLKIDVVNANIELEQRMRELGYNTTEMREDIQKAGAIIAKQSTILLSGEANVILNGKTYSVGNEVERQYIESSKALFLEDGNNDKPSA